MGIKRTELIRQIDLYKIGQKRQKYRNPNFPLYFWQNPLYFFDGLLGSLNGLKWIFCRIQTLSKTQFYRRIYLSENFFVNFRKSGKFDIGYNWPILLPPLPPRKVKTNFWIKYLEVFRLAPYTFRQCKVIGSFFKMLASSRVKRKFCVSFWSTLII